MVIVGRASATILTDTDCDPLPPAPVHVNVKVLLATRPVRTSLSASALLPVQPLELVFEAVHVVALVLLHVNFVFPPLTTFGGSALSVTVGTGVGVGGAADTVMVTSDTGLVPPGPLQKMLYFTVWASEPVPCDPEGSRAPFQPPPAVQEVAPVLVQSKVVEPLYPRDVNLAVRLTVGSGAGATLIVTDCAVLLPLAFAHVNV